MISILWAYQVSIVTSRVLVWLRFSLLLEDTNAVDNRSSRTAVTSQADASKSACSEFQDAIELSYSGLIQFHAFTKPVLFKLVPSSSLA
ncbi:hypothetical protein CDL15_Pgr006758 [Punica granatum]|uniref:Uncharacterized protein n=1 Tax=Punica granatum TaxID=22663 RepID=A0A218X7F8_PUNGR|nr:hypothetical protein CDL15_Pgr006758 [Punica granatum]